MVKILSLILSGRRGVALILTVGILALMAMLATTFALVTIMEQKGTWTYANGVKARFLAEAGISRAIAELKFGSQGVVADAVDTQTENWYATGYSDSTFFSGQGSYSVSIIDCASQINLNDQNTNARISQILQNLNTLLGSPLTVAECTAIAANRPYATKQQIKFYLTGPQINNKYNAIEPYITVYGYMDDVVDPTDLAVPVYESQPRTPINVNTASQVVLRAVLTGLQGAHICPNCGGDGQIQNFWACTECGGSGTLSISSTEAQALAQYIISNRPYSTWSQFYTSIKACPSIGPRDADLVMANANPNTGFSWARNAGWASRMGYVGKCVFDYNKNHVFDADDFGLTQSTTEFGFNSGGYYEITSTGSYKGSQKVVKAVVKLFDIFRETTQADFNSGTLNNVQTYPENTDAGVAAAIYDGQIMLPCVVQPTPPGGSAYFRTTYSTTVNADAGGGNLTLFDTANKPNIASIANFATGNSRGDLVPDGLLIDYFGPDYGYYRPVGNISPSAGTMEIWFKPKYNSRDCKLYGDSDQVRKMFRLTSGVIIDNGYPYETFFFWSALNTLWGALLGGGGYYNEATSTWEGKAWVQWFGLAAPVSWNTGQWNQIVISWKHPDDPFKSGQYNSTSNPVSLYFNGIKRTTSIYWYHSSYTDSSTDYALEAGFERDSFNGNAFELSNAVIGSVRIWDSMLTDDAIRTEYESGMYQKTGTYTYTSAAFDPGQNLLWGTITWTEAIPNGINGEIILDVDTGSGSFSGNWNDPGSGRSINTRGDSIRYRAALSASATPLLDTPVLEDVTITYLPRTQVLYVQ